MKDKITEFYNNFNIDKGEYGEAEKLVLDFEFCLYCTPKDQIGLLSTSPYFTTYKLEVYGRHQG